MHPPPSPSPHSPYPSELPSHPPPAAVSLQLLPIQPAPYPSNYMNHSLLPLTNYLLTLRCFFSLELPAYSSAAHCYDRLLYAITHCTQIDIDTTTAARENRDRDDGED